MKMIIKKLLYIYTYMRENRSSFMNKQDGNIFDDHRGDPKITAEDFLKRISMMNINIHTIISVPVLKY